MSRKGWWSPDNAACEGFFGRLKTELFYPGIGRPQQLSNSLRSLIPASAGTTKNGSRSPLVLSVHRMNIPTNHRLRRAGGAMAGCFQLQGRSPQALTHTRPVEAA
jgi:hypothetical protein